MYTEWVCMYKSSMVCTQSVMYRSNIVCAQSGCVCIGATCVYTEWVCIYRSSMVCTEFSCLHSSVSPEILEFISTIQKLIRGSPALRQIKFIEFACHVQCHCELQWMKLHRGSWCNKPWLGVGASQSTTVCCLEGRERPLGAGSGLW